MSDENLTSAEVGQEIARLDEIVVENDAQNTPNAEWRAADALYDKAELLADHEGPAAALPWFEDVVQRLEHRTDPGPRGLLISAQNAIAVLLFIQGRKDETRSALEAIVDQHFRDAPLSAAKPLANATVLLARVLHEAGEVDRAVELLEALIERYGRPEVPSHRTTAGAAHTWLGSFFDDAGDLGGGMRQFDLARDAIGDPGEDEYLRQLVARSLTGKAALAGKMGMYELRDELCREVLQRFTRDRDPLTIEQVKWARTVLEAYSPHIASLKRRRR